MGPLEAHEDTRTASVTLADASGATHVRTVIRALPLVYTTHYVTGMFQMYSRSHDILIRACFRFQNYAVLVFRLSFYRFRCLGAVIILLA